MGRPKKISQEEKKSRRKKPVVSVDGMNDILPEDNKNYDYVLEKFTKNVQPFSFKKINIPLTEKVELFSKKVGFSDDFVENNIFTLKTDKKEDLALRYDLTMGIARAYVQNNMSTMGKPVKLYSSGPVFINKNQKDSLRQANQFNMSIIGKGDPVIDAQVIFLTNKMLEGVGLKDLEIQINSVGCELCVGDYKTTLVDYIKSKKNRLCNECKKEVKKDIFNVFRCQNENCQNALEDAPEIIDSLCEDCNSHLKSVLEYLDDLGIKYNLNSRILKKINRNTRTAFEILTSSENESKLDVLAEGGRYDDLIFNIGGNDTRFMASSIYLDRVVELIKEKEIKVPEKKEKADVLLIQLGGLAKRKALIIFDDLVGKGINIKESLHKDSIKSQLRLAENLGVKIAVILGQKEILDKTALLRDMQSGIQEIVNLDKLVDELKKRLKN